MSSSHIKWDQQEAVAFLDAFCAKKRDLSPFRVAAVLAHPDDEVIGFGSRLPRLRKGLFVYVTDGAPRDLYDARRAGFQRREDYARARKRELYSALALAGISPAQTWNLGHLDQETSFHLPDITEQLVSELEGFQIVITHPYEGGHPDHDSTAFAVHAACRQLHERDTLVPQIVEVTSYHIRDDTIMTDEFLYTDAGDICTVVLSQEERAFKRQLLDCYASQRKTLRWIDLGTEHFRPAPDYDFTQAPHEGKLFYERFDWGMTGERWRELAHDALQRMEKTEFEYS